MQVHTSCEATMPKSVRTTISLPSDQYEELVRIAKDQRVSTSWVLRDAVRAYLASRYPLFKESADGIRDTVGIDRTTKKKES
jgi:metal-responsive CopG/Arc/MetJ family transcriptional regulator